MKYKSTRGGVHGLSFEDALYTGYASDGGILIPESIPSISKDTLKSWVPLSYKELAKKIVPLFVTEDEIPMSKLDGTSGDTGSAAIEAVKGLKFVDIIVLLPKGRCSKVQEQQMITANEDNVHVYRVEGTSDDLDIPIKEVFKDVDFCTQHNLSSINSINWARIMVQVVHYIYAYLQMCPNCDRDVEIIVPTGALGNVTSGFVARLMGVPVRFVCAVTQNDIVARAISKGDYSMSDNVIHTLAPAMDIQIPYNMERLWYLMTMDSTLVCKLMAEFETTGKVNVPTFLANKIKEIIVDTFVASDQDIKTTMKRTWEENQYQVCPHTAIGVACYYQQLHSTTQSKDTAKVVIATASVKKFEEAVLAAGLTPQKYQEVDILFDKPVKYVDMNKGDNWELILRNKIVEIDSRT